MLTKKYRIKIHYETGDSFGSKNTESYLELEWNNLDVAKENLKRIEEHYSFYKKLERLYSSQKKDKEVKKEMSKQRWAVLKYPEYCILLLADNGKEMQMSAFWCGYFERLYYAEIEASQDNDMKFSVKD